MTPTEQSIKDFCEMMVESLEKNEPMDYRGTRGLLIHILKLIEDGKENQKTESS